MDIIAMSTMATIRVMARTLSFRLTGRPSPSIRIASHLLLLRSMCSIAGTQCECHNKMLPKHHLILYTRRVYSEEFTYKPFQRFGCACALGRVNRYPELCH